MTSTSHIEIGTEVSYEDMSNPLRSGTIDKITIDRWGLAYQVKFEDGTEISTDMAQRGWKVAA